jgi:hypothetical protein
VRCNAAGQVTELIAYGGYGLRGTIDPAIGQLSSMFAFDVSGNPNVGGSLPTELVSLPALVYLRAHNAKYNGTLPSAIATKQWMYLDLENNYFTGAVPVGIRAIYSCQLRGNCFSPCSVSSPPICAFSQCRATCSRRRTIEAETCETCVASMGGGWCVDSGAPQGVCLQGSPNDAAERKCDGEWFFFTCAQPRSPVLRDVVLTAPSESRLAVQWSGGGESVVVRLVELIGMARFGVSVGLPDGPIPNEGQLTWDLPAAFPATGATVAVEITKVVVDADLGATALRQSALSNNVTIGQRVALPDARGTLVLGAFSDCEPECGSGDGVRTRVAYCAVGGALRDASECAEGALEPLTASCALAECLVFPLVIVEPRAGVIAVAGESMQMRWGGGVQTTSNNNFTLELAPIVDAEVGEFSEIVSSVNSSTLSWTVSSDVRAGQYVVRVRDERTGDSALSDAFDVRRRNVTYTLAWTFDDASAAPTGFVTGATLFGLFGRAKLPVDGAGVELTRGPGWARLVTFASESLIGGVTSHETSASGGSFVSWSSLRVTASDGSAAAEFGRGTSGVVQLNCLTRHSCSECVADSQCTFCDNGDCRSSVGACLPAATGATTLESQCTRIVMDAFNLTSVAMGEKETAMESHDGDDNTLTIALVVTAIVVLLVGAAAVGAVLLWRKRKRASTHQEQGKTEPPSSGVPMSSFRSEQEEEEELSRR